MTVTMTGPVTDITLLTALGQRDNPNWPAAWSRFNDIYGPILYRLAKKYGLQPTDADDMTQVVLITCVRTLPRFQYDRRRGRFRNWIITVAMNEIKKLWKKRDRLEGSLLPGADPEETETWFEGVETARVIDLAFDKLRGQIPADQYEAMQMIRAGRKPKEIAKAMGRDRNWVDGVKFRSLKRLRPIAEELLAEFFG